MIALKHKARGCLLFPSEEQVIASSPVDRFLIIEDNRADQVLLRVFFRRFNVKDEQLTFSSSLASLKPGVFRLIVCDLGLRDSESLRTLESVRRIYPDVPVVVLTESSAEQFGMEAIRLGAQDYLVKGEFNDQHFFRTIQFAIQRHFLQREVSLTRDEYDELFDTNPQPSFVYDIKSLRIRKVNRRFTEVYGYTHEEAIQLNVRDIREERDHGRLEEDVKRLQKSGLIDFSAITHRKKNGELITVEVSSQRLRHSGSEFAIATMNDISEKTAIEKSLLLSNERFEHATRATRDVIYDWNLLTNELLWGESLNEQFGYETNPGNFNIHKWTQSIHPEDCPQFIEQLDEVLSGTNLNAVRDREYRLRRSDGSYAHVTDRSILVQSEDGKGLRLIGAIEDISDRKTAELKLEDAFHKLQKYNSTYEELFAEVPAFICYLEGKDHVFQLANPECLRLTDKQAVIGSAIGEILPELVGQGIIQQLDKVYHTGKSLSRKEFPLSFRNSDGSWRRVYLNCIYQANRNASGEVDGIFVFGVDVTDLVISRNKIAAAGEERKVIRDNLSALINSTDDLIWSVDKKGYLISANKPFLERVRAMTGKDIHEGDLLELKEFGRSNLTKWQAHYKRAFSGERFTMQEEEWGDGKKVHLLFTFNPIFDQSGNVSGIACYSKDVTERTNHLKAIEEQNRQFKEIAWLQSHIARAPLARILGLVDLIKHGDFDDNVPLEKLIEFLSQSAHELDRVITKISTKTELTAEKINE